MSKEYILKNEFIKFNVIIDNDIDIIELENFFGNYAKFEQKSKDNNQFDLTIKITNNTNLFLGKDNYFIVDNHMAIYKDNIIYVLSNNKKEDILFIKRLLSDLINRYIEKKGGIFLHSSSIVDDSKSIIFIGDKGSGKTTNMLYILEQYQLGYSANERTGIILKDDIIRTYGNPARINIRANTLNKNEKLIEKLWCCIEKEDYEKYKSMLLSRDCSERLIVSFRDLEERLGVKIIPFANIYAICNLIYDSNIDFYMEKVNYDTIKESLENSIINGVYPNRSILNDVFETETINIDKLLYRNDINYYNIYHNASYNNSENIIKILKRERKNEKDIK